MQIIVGILVIVLLLIFARRLIRLLLVLFSVFIAFAASALAAVVAMVVAELSGMSEPALVAVPLGILVFIVFLVHRLRRLGKRGDDAVLDASLPSVQADQVSEPQPELEPIIDGDAQLRAAWERALQLAPRQRERLMIPRRDCAALLAIAETETLDQPIRDRAVMVKRNVPLLVAKVDALCSSMAKDNERAALVKDLVEDLAQIGTSARRIVDAHQNTLRDDLAALRNHVKARTAEHDL